MSNMKNVDRLTIAHGNVTPPVLSFTVSDFGRLQAGVEEIEEVGVTRAEVNGNNYAVVQTDMNKLELYHILECLDDHINSISEEELRSRLMEDDYHCASPTHVLNNIECHCSQDDCMPVRVYEHTYYGPGCIAICYHVVPAE